MAFLYSDLLEKLLLFGDLDAEEANWLMSETMSGGLTPAQISAWLVALRCKGETALEIGTFAAVMREKAEPVAGIEHPVLDTCGTGGDKSHLMNISTLSAIVLANRGIRVAKHGNRSVSSSSGSADILEKLGYTLTKKPEEVAADINNKNFGFFFAPAFHPAMKFAGPVRKEIGIRTVFNILGPLSNPAHAEIHLLGVFRDDYRKPLAEALERLGAKTFMVVHSRDGLDEISPVALTDYFLFFNGKYHEGVIDPSWLNIKISSLEELQVKNPDEALDRAKKVLEGKDSAGIQMVALNAAAAEYLWMLHLGKTSEPPETFIKQAYAEIKEGLELGKYGVANLF